MITVTLSLRKPVTYNELQLLKTNFYDMSILFLKSYNFLLDNKCIIFVGNNIFERKKNLNDNKANVISKLHDKGYIIVYNRISLLYYY